MANTLKLRGGTTAEVAAATLAEREIMVDTTKDVIVVGPSKKEMAVGNGGTYTGNYTFSGNVNLSGATTFGTSINANSLRIQNVATPTGTSDATNKSYVDAQVTSIINTTLPGNVFSADGSVTIVDNNPGVGDIDLALTAGSVTTAKLANNSITTDKIVDNNVTGVKFANNTITTAKIADQAITSAKLAVDSVTSNRIAAGAVGTTRIADSSITALKITTDAVTTDKIQDDAVTAGKLANTSVTAGNYTAADITVDAQGRITAAASGAISTAEITDAAVTTAKIADDAITEAKIANDAVTTDRILDGAATAAKIANGAVTEAKIDSGVLSTHATQVTACANSATSAANSATSAATSAAAAAAAFDNFDDTYLGQKASDPTTDNDGDALTAGDLYYNTTAGVMKVYIGSSWVTAYVPGDAANISSTAVGNVAATNVQAAIQELDSEKLPVTGYTGNVGIGTSSPGEILHVNGAACAIKIDSNGDAALRFATSGTNKFSIYHTSGGTLNFFDNTNSSNRLIIDSSGNVGIGTSSPARQLSVNDFSGNGTVSINAGTSNASTLYFADAATATGVYTGFIQYNHSSNAMQFAVNDGVERMRIDSSGRLLVGTSTAGSGQLTVASTSHTGITIRSGSTSTNSNLIFADAASGADVGVIQYKHSDDSLRITVNNGERLRIDSSGNVGIGCVPSSFQSGFDALQIGGNLVLNVDSTGVGAGVYMSNNVYRDSGNSRWEYINTDEASQYLQANGEHVWRYATSGSANSAITWGEAMRIDSSGRVAIGTTSIADTATALVIKNSSSGNDHTLLDIVCDTNETARVRFSEDGSNFPAEIKYDTFNHFLAFNANSAERMRIDSSGNVGIGSTSPTADGWSVANDLVINNNTGNSGMTIKSGSSAFGLYITSLTTICSARLS